MKLFLMLLALSAGANAQDLKTFSVFSTKNIVYDRSDFEGNVIASNIKVTDFLFNKSNVLIADKFEMTRGMMQGTAKAGYGIWLLNTSAQSFEEVVLTSDVMKIDMSMVSGFVRTNWLNIPESNMGFPNSMVGGKKAFSKKGALELKAKIESTIEAGTKEMFAFSNRCLALENKPAEMIGNNLVLNANSYHYTVINTSAEEMVNAAKVVINGSGPDRSVIVNVSGENINFTNLGFILKNISPEQIIWNLYEAKTLKIYHSGTEAQFRGRAIGFPGTILAPSAVTKFHEAVITGNLWVNDLNGSSTDVKIHGGQVNGAPYIGYPCEETRIVIKE